MLNEILKNIMLSSIIGSIIILFIILISNTLDKKYKIKWRYFIWLVISIYLLIPVDLSIEKPLVNIETPEIMVREISRENINSEKILNGENEINNIVNNNYNNSNELNNVKNTEEIKDIKSTNKLEINIEDIIIGIYLIGIVSFTFYHIYIYRKFKNKIYKNNKIIEDENIIIIFNKLKEEYNIKNNIEIKINSEIESPVVLGLFEKILLLPDIKLSEEKLNMILRHELIHIKRNDILYKFIILLARAVHWFNPVVHLMGKKSNEDIEITCDLEVVENMDENYKKDYSNTILDIAGNNIEDYIFTTNFSGGKNSLKNRFENILSGVKKKSRYIGIGVLAIILSITFLVSCDGDKKDEETETGIESIFGKDYIKYENNDFGIEINLPESWKDKYEIVENEDNIIFFYKKIFDELSEGGTKTANSAEGLFTLNRLQGKLYSESDIEKIGLGLEGIRLMGNNEDYTYYFDDLQKNRPRGNNFTEEYYKDEEYKNMIKDLEDIKMYSSIKINPKVNLINEEYKKIGSVFFTGEIPADWELGFDNNNDFKFNLYKDKKIIGYVESIPIDKYNIERENGYIDYIVKDNNSMLGGYNKLRISILEEYKTEGDKISDSIILTDRYSSINLRNRNIEKNIFMEQSYTELERKVVIGNIEEIHFNRENNKDSYLKIKYYENNIEKIEDIYLGNNFLPIILLKNGMYEKYGYDYMNDQYYNEHLDITDKLYEIYIREDWDIELSEPRIQLLVETKKSPIELVKADDDLYKRKLDAINIFNKNYIPEDIVLSDIFYTEEDEVEERTFYQNINNTDMYVRYVVDRDDNIKFFKIYNYKSNINKNLSKTELTDIGRKFMEGINKTYYLVKENENINHISGDMINGNIVHLDKNTGKIIYYSDNYEYQTADELFQNIILK